MTTTISVIIPVFNEEGNIKELYRRLNIVLKMITQKYEVIFVNDGSTDKSMKIITNLRMHDKRIKMIVFSRNFGHMAAVSAGLAASVGKKVIVMDADLEDPPEVIEQMYKKSLKGYDVVYGVKTKRKESKTRRFLFSLFYKILNGISSYKMPANAGTFSLVDRRVVNILVQLPEKNKYISGLRAWTGFSQCEILYARGKRYFGKPASFARLFSLALNGILSFSYVPLRFSSFLGIIFALVAFIFIFIVIILRFIFGLGIVGWASTISSVLLMGGVQLITLGIIGEYLARIYDEVKNRPEYIISKKVGF